MYRLGKFKDHKSELLFQLALQKEINPYDDPSYFYREYKANKWTELMMYDAKEGVASASFVNADAEGLDSISTTMMQSPYSRIIMEAEDHVWYVLDENDIIFGLKTVGPAFNLDNDSQLIKYQKAEWTERALKEKAAGIEPTKSKVEDSLAKAFLYYIKAKGLHYDDKTIQDYLFIAGFEHIPESIPKVTEETDYNLAEMTLIHAVLCNAMINDEAPVNVIRILDYFDVPEHQIRACLKPWIKI